MLAFAISSDQLGLLIRRQGVILIATVPVVNDSSVPPLVAQTSEDIIS